MRSLVYLLVMLLLSSVPAFAGMTMIMSGGGAAGGGDCPAGTYLFAYNGDHGSGTTYACFTNGDTAKNEDEANTLDSISTDYVQFDAVDEHITWAISGGDGCDDSLGTIYFDIFIVSFGELDASGLVEAINDSDNKIQFKVNAGGTIQFLHRGNGTQQWDNSSASVTTDTWYRVASAWETGAGGAGISMCVASDGNCTGDWEAAADAGGLVDFDGADPMDTISIGENLMQQAVNDTFRIRNMVCVADWQGTDPLAW